MPSETALSSPFLSTVEANDACSIGTKEIERRSQNKSTCKPYLSLTEYLSKHSIYLLASMSRSVGRRKQLECPNTWTSIERSVFEHGAQAELQQITEWMFSASIQTNMVFKLLPWVKKKLNLASSRTMQNYVCWKHERTKFSLVLKCSFKIRSQLFKFGLIQFSLRKPVANWFFLSFQNLQWGQLDKPSKDDPIRNFSCIFLCMMSEQAQEKEQFVRKHVKCFEQCILHVDWKQCEFQTVVTLKGIFGWDAHLFLFM